VSVPATLVEGRQYTSATVYAVPGEGVPAKLAAGPETITVEVPAVDLWSIIILK
jgi:hypothetical protein